MAYFGAAGAAAWVGATAAILAALYYGPRKMLSTWEWYVCRFRDWKYGEFRPTRKEIDKMLSDEYKKHFRDPKFRKWVDHFPAVKDPPWEKNSKNP